MKLRLLICYVLFFAFAKAGFSQITPYTLEDISGAYVRDPAKTQLQNNNEVDTRFEWSLTLSPDGRFEYHNFRQIKGQEEEHWYGQGAWSFKGKIIYFVTNATDLDSKYTIDLNNSKARFFKKSERNTSNKKQPTYIQFFTSEYPVAKRLKLFKTHE